MRFYEFVTEKVKYKSSLSQKVFKPDQLENEGDLTYGLWLPLSNSIVNKIMPKQRARVFHVTSVENISNMLSLQGQKKSISAFLNMDPYFFSQGIFGGGGGGIVFELDSNVLGAFNRDVESSVDDSGRRWITLYALIEYSGKNRNDLQPMYNDMGKLIQRLLDKHAPDMDYTDEYDDYVLTTDKWEELGKKLNTDGDSKKLSVVIKDYIDGVYAIMMKYARPIGQALQSALIDSDPDGDWDEIIVNDIKIMQAHVLKDSTENTEKLKELESKGIKVRVWDSSQELSNYTKKVGAQQKLGENFADGKKKVNEVLDKPAPYTWRKNEFGFPTAEAKDLGLHISFDGRNQPDWEVSFYREQDNGNVVMNRPTGQGREFQVFATVNAAIKDFMKMQDDVEGLTLDARKDGGVDGQGRVSLYRRMMNNYAKKLGWGFEEWDQGQMVMMGIYKPRTNENFADGKKKGKSRPGRVKRSGASCNGSVTALRKRAKNSSGEKAKMYHWCANMKSGRKKKS